MELDWRIDRDDELFTVCEGKPATLAQSLAMASSTEGDRAGAATDNAGV